MESSHNLRHVARYRLYALQRFPTFTVHHLLAQMVLWRCEDFLAQSALAQLLMIKHLHQIYGA
jgi:hypothetical protein